MQAQTYLEAVSREQEAAIGRRLLEANALYARSNNDGVSPDQRDHARAQVREILHSVLMAKPGHADALNLLGRVALDEGDTDTAATRLNKALEARPDCAQILTNLGYHGLMTQQPESAVAFFEQALEADRQSVAAFAGKAHALRQQGAFDTAFLHYRRLLDFGLEWPSVYTGMLECTRNLRIDRADEALARDAIRLLSRDDLPHQELADFVTALLRQQYSAGIRAGDWLLDTASADELLLLALEKTLLPDPELERLITTLRTAILREVRDTGELCESRQRLAMVLALYTTRTGFAQIVSDEETRFISELDSALADELRDRPEPAAVAGALIVRSLYGALFHQSYAAEIGARELADWPLGMQQLMAASFYNKAREEAYKQNFEEKQQELVLDRADLPHPWPCWRNTGIRTAQPLRRELSASLNLNTESWPETARILVVGAGSGQRSVEIAQFFTDVEVVAVDEDLSGLAHGDRIAREKGLDNIVFWPYSLASRFISDGHRVQMVQVHQLPSRQSDAASVTALVHQALDSGGVLHIHTGEHGSSRMDVAIRRLMERHRLEPTTASLRRLRRMILNNPQQDAYRELLRDPDFYATAGCRKRWFFPEDQGQLHELVECLGNEVDWKLLQARDTDGAELATTPVLRQLQAQTFGSGTQTLVGQGLSLYFQRRR